MAIDRINLTPRTQLPLPTASSAAPAPVTANSNEMVGSFKNMLGELLGSTDALQKQSQEMTQQLATGQITNVHDVMIAAEKAKTAMQLTLAIRGKLLEAYQALQQLR
ncbi:MAG TPA: flagellar hook-basal body complex protein FliE [bacterium]|nr:flagellar hook-basal body complex protein FliE [bacterium]